MLSLSEVPDTLVVFTGNGVSQCSVKKGAIHG